MNSHLITSAANLRSALEKLNSLSGGVMTLFVLAPDGRLAGSLTDGDIRRALLAGITLDDNVAMAMNQSFRVFDPSDPSQISRLRHSGIKLLPETDSEGRLISLIDLTRTRARLPLKAILMAGGFGERLRPMTLTVPKPLLEIEGKAIIDYNIEMLARVGISDITVATRYLSERIEAHFAGEVAEIQVKCVRETSPLGTIGAATLVPLDPEGSTLVMNSDILTSIRLEDMYERHVACGNDVTIAAIPYSVSVPYAILSTEESRVVALEEKPTYSYLANAGIYIFSNRVLLSLKKDTRTDATTLIEEAIAAGKRVGYYTVDGTWIDIGTPADFAHAAEMMRHHRNFEI